MTRRQSMPRQWLVIADEKVPNGFRRLPPGTGALVVRNVSKRERHRLLRLARYRRLPIVFGGSRGAARVHDVGELRTALLRRTPLILISPIYETASHPDWRPIPRMRAAALARLAGRNAIALGGMNRKRYATVARLGFSGWAGISAFRT